MFAHRLIIVLNSSGESWNVGDFGVESRAELLSVVAVLRNAARKYRSWLIASIKFCIVVGGGDAN